MRNKCAVQEGKERCCVMFLGKAWLYVLYGTPPVLRYTEKLKIQAGFAEELSIPVSKLHFLLSEVRSYFHT